MNYIQNTNQREISLVLKMYLIRCRSLEKYFCSLQSLSNTMIHDMEVKIDNRISRSHFFAWKSLMLFSFYNVAILYYRHII